MGLPVETKGPGYDFADWNSLTKAHPCWNDENWVSDDPEQHPGDNPRSFYTRLKLWHKNGWDFRKKPLE